MEVGPAEEEDEGMEVTSTRVKEATARAEQSAKAVKLDNAKIHMYLLDEQSF
jgi:hypothetical protein